MPLLRRIVYGLVIMATACSHEIKSPEPSLSTVAPDLVCNGPSVSGPDGVTSVTLTGRDFTPMPSKTLEDKRELILPKVTLSPAGALPGLEAPTAPFDIVDDPASPAGSRVHWTSETSMSFDVAPADMLPAGVFDVTVTNPDDSRATKLAQRLALIPPPVIMSAAPMAICDDQADQTVEVTGTSFLFFDGAAPTVTIMTPGTPKVYTATVVEDSCEVIPGRFSEENVRLCTALRFTVPEDDIVVTQNTKFDLIVTNPPPADCASSTTFQITINAPPKVDSVAPSTVCQGGAQLTINGSNFIAGASVKLVCPGVTVTAGTVNVNATGTQISATVGGGAPPGETCQVVVTNPDGCEDVPTPHKTVSVVTGPILFQVDPSVVYNGINTRVTLYATTIAGPLPNDAVKIQMGATVTQLQFSTVTGFPNRLQATVPMNQAAGTYDIILKDALNCPSTLPSALRVTATTTVTLKEVNPPFGHTLDDTAVTIFRDPAAVAPNDKPFVATPRVFLNPNNPAANDVAVPLEANTFLDMDRMTGVVPANTPARLYDVILVNPDGTVGLLVGGYRSTATPPPIIESATPASIVAATGQVVNLAGTNFGAGNTVTLNCKTPTNTFVMPPVTTVEPTCTPGCTQQITINALNVPVGSACVVRLTNTDGVYGEFSAIGVTNASLNLSAPKAGPLMTVARRALSAASGNATNANRFVYAIGGDSGMVSGALDSVEFAPVDLFGTVGAYQAQPYALRAPRTLGQATSIGRYIYLVGGNNGAGQIATAERALILSPREVPQVIDIDLQLANAGLDAGEYRYRVSAVFDAADLHNPGGETLAGDEFTVKVPSFPNKKVVLTLVWDAPTDALGAVLPNIVGYRIYRTAKDGASGTEVLLGTTNAATPRTFVDNGSLTLGTATPLPLGSTGRWAALPELGTAREGLGLTAAADPALASTFHLYALLGRSSGTTALATYEYLTITAQANGRHTTGATWTAGNLPSGQARWQLGAWTANSTVSPDYTGTTAYVFLGGGLTANNMAAQRVDAGLVTSGGQLANTTAGATTLDNTPTDFNQIVAGYGVCAANDQLFTFGGVNAMPATGANAAELSTPPSLDVGAWNNEGLTMTQARYLLGSTVQSAFIFLLGGQTASETATRTTETVIW